MSTQALSRPTLPSLQQVPDHQVIQLPPDNPSTRSLASLTSLRAETNSERPGRAQSTMGDIPSLSRLVPTRRNTRQVVPKQDDETMIQSRIEHYIDEFVALNYGLLIIFGVFLLMTQAFEVGFVGAIVAIQLIIGLHFLFLLKNQCTLETQDAKRKNGYKMLEDILTVILLFTIQEFISDPSSPNSVIALTAIFLTNQVVKTWCLFSWGNKSEWRFDRYFNSLVFLFKLCAIAQIILILVRCIHSFTSWVYIFTPIYIIAGLLVVHFAHSLWVIFSKTGRTLWKPLTWNKIIGLSWMLTIPVIFAAGLVWCALYIAGLADDDSAEYTIADRPLLLLFIGVIIVTMLALFSIYCFENAITLTSKYIACLFDIATENQARALAIIKKLQEDYVNSVEDRQIPEILLKVSNAYFKLVKKDKQVKVNPLSAERINIDVPIKFFLIPLDCRKLNPSKS